MYGARATELGNMLGMPKHIAARQKQGNLAPHSEGPGYAPSTFGGKAKGRVMVPSANRFVPASCFSLCDTVAL
jgi:hypothetical protein